MAKGKWLKRAIKYGPIAFAMIMKMRNKRKQKVVSKYR